MEKGWHEVTVTFAAESLGAAIHLANEMSLWLVQERALAHPHDVDRTSVSRSNMDVATVSFFFASPSEAVIFKMFWG